MRINKIFHQRENALIIYQILPTDSVRKIMYRDQLGEFVSRYWGLKVNPDKVKF